MIGKKQQKSSAKGERKTHCSAVETTASHTGEEERLEELQVDVTVHVKDHGDCNELPTPAEELAVALGLPGRRRGSRLLAQGGPGAGAAAVHNI